MLTRSFYLVRSMFAWRQPGCSNLIWSDRVGWTALSGRAGGVKKRKAS